MGLILVYDTETSGLPLFDQPSEHPGQPHITQLAAELCDDGTGQVHAALNLIVLPQGWAIPAELEKLTGITNGLAQQVGLPEEHVVDLFFALWRKADVRVAHNENFDARILRIALKRFSSERQVDVWAKGLAFCTCTASVEHVKCPPTSKMLRAGRTGYKNPNLGEAYKHFTGKDLEGAHNAAVDIMACKAVYFALKRL